MTIEELKEKYANISNEEKIIENELKNINESYEKYSEKIHERAVKIMNKIKSDFFEIINMHFSFSNYGIEKCIETEECRIIIKITKNSENDTLNFFSYFRMKAQKSEITYNENMDIPVNMNFDRIKAELFLVIYEKEITDTLIDISDKILNDYSSISKKILYETKSKTELLSKIECLEDK